LPVLEALSFPREGLDQALADLRQRTGAAQVCVLSTCERIELYASWPRAAEPEALVRALAGNRGVPVEVVQRAATHLSGREAGEHLLRVTAGLESFVLGERDIAGQVRAAAEASRGAGGGALELERLLDTAVHTSRRVHRNTSFGASGRSVAAAGVHRAATEYGGDLRGRRVLMVGAGQVATEVVESATRLGAEVTVCNRTRRHAERLAAAGAEIVDLSGLFDALVTTDVAIFGTAAPHRLLDAARLAPVRRRDGRDLLLVDLSIPRDVDPDVRSLPGVRLLHLSDLRAATAQGTETVTDDVARAEEIVAEELDRYFRWLAGRTAAVPIRRLRADVESCTRTHIEQITRVVPEEVRPIVEDGIRRLVGQLAHGPTKRLLEAAEAGDDALVALLGGMFDTEDERSVPRGVAAATAQAPGSRLSVTASISSLARSACP
jgi:glutamyl-tRNA reductase